MFLFIEILANKQIYIIKREIRKNAEGEERKYAIRFWI
jgi:hypothetical protein